MLKHKTMTGMIKCFGSPQPEVGKTPSCTEKKYCSREASTNTGMVMPNMAMNITR